MPTARIHPSAVVDPACEFGEGVEIGPGCVLTGQVRLAENVRLVSHVVMQGPVSVGAGTTVYPNVCVGFPPQDVKFKLGDPTPGVVIGRDCLLRESVTIHAASKPEAPTTVGDRCFLMVQAHLGHDVRIGNDCTLVNNTMLAGHVQMGDRVLTGGAAGLAQFVRVGSYAFIGGAIGITLDVAPYALCITRSTMNGINVVGLRRAGFPREHIDGIRRAYREAFVERLPRAEMVERLRAIAETCPPVRLMADFVASTKRGVCTAAVGGETAE